MALFFSLNLPGVSPGTNSPRLATVNVLVFDEEGHAVSGLDRNQFLLKDNGERRAISGFKALRPPQKLLRKRPDGGYWISNRPEGEEGASRPATVILLDSQNTGPPYQPWSISQVARFISLLGPEEPVAVYELRQGGLFLLHEFTANHEHLLAAIAPEAMVHDPQTKKWSFDFKRIRVAPAPRPGHSSPDHFSYDALKRLACQMGQYPGRKNLFWISAEFPRLFPYEKSTAVDPPATDAAHALEASGVAVFPVDVRSPVPPVPFQPTPPLTGAKAPSGSSQEFMRNMSAIADATGGKAIVNRPELAEAMIDMMRATQRSYQIGFEIPADQLDGQYHSIRLDVQRRGLAAIYNRGYFAQASRPCVQDAPFDNSAIDISVRISPITPPQPDDAKLLLQIRLFAASSEPKGLRATQWQISVKDGDSGATLAATVRNGLQLDVPTNVPEHSRRLCVSVREEGSGRKGTVAIPLDAITRAQMGP